MKPKLLSLFTGYGGLDEAVRQVFDTELAYVADVDPGACLVLAHRYPDIPNLGDVTTVDWASLRGIDVICGGSPCQDLSTAGRRAGMSEGTRSNLWAAMREAIAVLRPSLVIWENVRGALSAPADSALEPCEGCVGDGSDQPSLRALGRVLGDLADLGYDAQWVGLPASGVGAPHKRFRIFLIAYPQGDTRWLEYGNSSALADPENVGHERLGRARLGRPGSADSDSGALTLLPTCAAMDSSGAMSDRRETSGFGPALRDIAALLPTPSVADALGGHISRSGARSDELLLPGVARELALLPTPMVGSSSEAAHGQISGQYRRQMDEALSRWGQYTDAIERWETVTREAPPPTELGPKGSPRLSARFSEWMMGLPDGWITDVPGVTRNMALKLAGNGVVTQQAFEALWFMRAREIAWNKAAA